MNVYAISDLHLSTKCNKPMNVFGGSWENYLSEIEEDWAKKVTNEDIVLIAGDISWAMRVDEAIPDLEYISKLVGKKVMIKGNHDYWWQSIGNVRNVLPKDMYVIQNDAIRFDGVVICGSRGWVVPEVNHKSEDDERIYNRELLRMRMSLETAVRIKQPDDKLLCMIHYPPFNSKFAPSDFTRLFEEFHVDAVIYGHLHGHDVYFKQFLNIGGVNYYLTSCDLVQNKLTKIL